MTPAWFIGIIVYFYIFAPLIIKWYMWLHARTSLIWRFCLVIVITIVCHYLGYAVGKSYDIRNFIGCLPLFIFGFLAYDLYYENKSLISNFYSGSARFIYLIVAVLIFVMLECCYVKRGGIFFGGPTEAIVGIFGVVLLVIFLTDESKTKKDGIVYLIRRFYSKVGEQAYGLYLWHGLVIILFLNSGILGIDPSPYRNTQAFLIAFLVTVVISYAFSIIFYHILEKPFHRLYKRHILK